MRWLLVTVLLALLSLTLALPAAAADDDYSNVIVDWVCQPGYADTLANEQSGMCVLHPTATPTPRPECECVVYTPTPVPPCECAPPPATATPMPPVATSTPTQVPPTSIPLPPPPSQPQVQQVIQATSVPGVPGAPGSLVALCHYEPSTGNVEERQVHPWEVPGRLRLGDTLMTPGAVCAQPTATPLPATSTPVPATQQPVAPQPQVEAPAATEVGIPPLPPALAITAVPALAMEEEAPAIPVPEALPATGDPAAAAYCAPQDDPAWWDWYNVVGWSICS